jgi:hypothetical protein
MLVAAASASPVAAFRQSDRDQLVSEVTTRRDES